MILTAHNPHCNDQILGECRMLNFERHVRLVLIKEGVLRCEYNLLLLQSRVSKNGRISKTGRKYECIHPPAFHPIDHNIIILYHFASWYKISLVPRLVRAPHKRHSTQPTCTHQQGSNLYLSLYEKGGNVKSVKGVRILLTRKKTNRVRTHGHRHISTFAKSKTELNWPTAGSGWLLESEAKATG